MQPRNPLRLGWVSRMVLSVLFCSVQGYFQRCHGSFRFQMHPFVPFYCVCPMAARDCMQRTRDPLPIEVVQYSSLRLHTATPVVCGYSDQNRLSQYAKIFCTGRSKKFVL